MQAPPPADSLRAVLDTVFAAPAYDWVEQEHPFGWIERAWFALVDFIARLRAAEPLLFRIGLALLIALLLAILLHAGWVMLRTMRHAAAAEERTGTARVAERRDAAWYDREADRLADAGRHVDALQAAFTALALRLEVAGAVRYDPARTPREYVRHATLGDADRRRLQSLVAVLYRHVFGGAPAAAEDYARWRAAAAESWHVAAG